MSDIKNKQLREFAEAFEIFDKYVPENSYAEIHGEHDVIMLGGDFTKEEVSEEDMKKLDDLGWFFSGEYDSFATFG